MSDLIDNDSKADRRGSIRWRFQAWFRIAADVIAAKRCGAVLGALLICVASLSAQDATGSAGRSVKPGINDQFVDPELDVSEWMARFEIESREVYAARREVLQACGIKPGDSVADIGAGTGFYSRLFADAVGNDGWVFAVDISPRFLEHINFKARQDQVHNLTAVLCSDRSVNLPPKSIDVAFICDTYHHFEYPYATIESIFKAIKPGGSLIVIDFDRIPGKSREFILGHVRAGKDVFRGEIEKGGFEFVDEVQIPAFEENYLLRFRKPPGA
ncbi:Ubiquinone/menaquinone biosynthesis C-methyltransferase UbiE [Stieleria maiorica]|uniref:Ubiquinone/menaquinone biosynthesis C-methyltransferase UbiE n=1 Tax=Stieleria maiorica TaxID=2795974 RepID=A0A5B9MDC1_9BACT|nr:methyltransferase domain-containing protein [Stieleria maiorica]QEF98509.1 Ubiquinone/menaquinone biosynthesis C-methyltransferase UbiE [Stieleria maiorica]